MMLSKKIVITFLGGRPLPNVQFILSQKPDVVYVVVSKDSTAKGGNLEKLMAALPVALTPKKENCIAVNPYDMQETMDVCLRIFEKHKSETIMLNLASEPTTMALAAYKTCMDCMEKYTLQLFYSSRDGLVDILGQDTLPKPINIRLKDYFKVYGWDIVMQSTTHHPDLLALLARDISTTHDLLSKIRQTAPIGKNFVKQKITITDVLPKEKALLLEIQQMGKIDSVKEISPDTFSFMLSPDIEQFFRGSWLECYVFDVAKAMGKFDECAWNILAENNVGELDFAGILNGQLVIASCKTDRKTKNINAVDYFRELSARAEQLGKGMCTKMLLLTQTPSLPQKTQYEKWAKEYGVFLVMANDIQNLKERLQEALSDRSRI